MPRTRDDLCADIRTLPISLEDMEMKPEEEEDQQDPLGVIPEGDDDEETHDTEERVEEIEQPPRDEASTATKDPLTLAILDPSDDEAVRWLIYKRIFVSDAYSLAMDNIMTTNCACICFGVFSMVYNYIGFIKAFFSIFLGLPMLLIIACRTLVLWRLILRSGPDIRKGVHEYWVKGDPNRSIFAAKYKSKVIGTVAVVALSKTVVEVTRVATDRECCRQGVGSCLMQYVLQVCQKSGFEEVVLTVGESNVPACVLFEKFGFGVRRQVGDTFFKLLKWKGYMMSLKLKKAEESEVAASEKEKEKDQGGDEQDEAAITPIQSLS